VCVQVLLAQLSEPDRPPALTTRREVHDYAPTDCAADLDLFERWKAGDETLKALATRNEPKVRTGRGAPCFSRRSSRAAPCAVSPLLRAYSYPSPPPFPCARIRIGQLCLLYAAYVAGLPHSQAVEELVPGIERLARA